MDRGHQRRRERDRDGEDRQRHGGDVGWDAGQRHLTEGRQQQRHDRQLGADGQTDAFGETSRQPVGASGDPGGEHQHPEGRRSRQAQPRRGGQLRVEQRQGQHRAGERMPGVTRVAAQHHDQEQAGHGPGTEHRRLVADQMREREQRQTGSHPTGHGRPPQRRTEQQHPTDDHSGVGPADGDEVGERGVQQQLVGIVGQGPGVAGDHAELQRADGVVVAADGGREGVLTDPVAGAGHRACTLDVGDLPGGEPDAEVLIGEPAAVPAVRQRRGGRLQREPVAERRRPRVAELAVVDDPDRPLPGGDPVGGCDPHRHVPADVGGVRFGSDLDVERGRTAACGELRQRPELQGRGADRRAAADHDRDQQHPGEATADRVAEPGGGDGCERDPDRDRRQREPDRGCGHRRQLQLGAEAGPDAAGDQRGGRPHRQRPDRRAGWCPAVGHPTLMRSASSWKRVSPIPDTSRRSPG